MAFTEVNIPTHMASRTKNCIFKPQISVSPTLCHQENPEKIRDNKCKRRN
uniref:Uncharacterized protein n=1 Tax=Rhizophora mucronata TaxID=61149 RepID=A0A2P2PBX3_RHIMU